MSASMCLLRASALPLALSLGFVPTLADALTLGPYRADDAETGLAIAEQGDRALLNIRADVTLPLLELSALVRARPIATE